MLTEESRNKIEKLPLVMRTAAQMMIQCIERMINGECNEDEVTSTIGTLNQNSQGRYSNVDLMNYDKAGEILGFGTTNRVGLKSLLDKHGIKQVVFNNRKCGFRSSEILALRDKLNSSIRQRELKIKAKEERELAKARRNESRYRAMR